MPTKIAIFVGPGIKLTKIGLFSSAADENTAIFVGHVSRRKYGLIFIGY
jgi:hypothetical protein